MSSTLRFLPLGLFLALAPLESRAVIVAGGDGTQNSSAPANDFGFANVGQCFDSADGFFASCVYLDSNWVLTAYHVVRARDGLGGFELGPVIFRDPDTGNVTFEPIAGSGVRLRNADNSFTDLALFQIAAVPAFLEPTVIASQTPAGDSPVILAGNGISRGPDLTKWRVDTSTAPDTWTEVTTGRVDEQGYKLSGPTSLRWGSNHLEDGVSLLSLPVAPTTIVSTAFGAVTTVRTDFDDLQGEAQGVPGDSGSGLFYDRGTWELLGVIVARDGKIDQPGDSAVFGNSTYAAHLPTYRQQILATIPEPSTAGLLIVGAGAISTRRRRAR